MSQRSGRPQTLDFWGVTSFFSSSQTGLQLDNLRTSASAVRRQGLPLLIVEMALGDAPHLVPADLADAIVRVRTDTLVWQKERLLNIGIAELPAACTFVAWLDADVLFENEGWLQEARAQLENQVVVQLYDTCCLLGPGVRAAPTEMPIGIGDGQQLGGFAATVMRSTDRRRLLMDYGQHGHTGLAWAGTRAFLQRHGLYDRAIVGGGDVIHAHAFAADEDFIRGRTWGSRMLARRERAATAQWARGVSDETAGRMGWVSGRGLHLYHGPSGARSYDTRTQILKDEDYDPHVDIALDDDGCWRWNSDKPELHRRVAEYFGARLGTASVMPVTPAPPPST